MRFLIVSLGFHPDVIGGAWRVAAAHASGLADRGHDVHVITAAQQPSAPALESRGGFTLHRFPPNNGHFFANWRAANRAARDLIHARLRESDAPTLLVQHHAYLGPAATRAARRLPVLHVFHGPWAEEYRLAQTARPRSLARRCLDVAVIQLLHRVETRTLRQARRILVLSRHFARHLARWHPGPLAPVEIVPGGVDFQRFTPAADRAGVRHAQGLQPDETLFVAMRRLDPRMGLDLLVEAFARVHPRFPRTRLWLTGRGPAENALRDQIRRLGLESAVRLLGFLAEEELPRLLNAADATLMPSLDLEGFGLATAESLACGTPVLGSNAGATPELLEPLDPGLLFQAGSVDAITRRLEMVLANPGSLPSRAHCAAYARERFSWDAQTSACERTALELLSPRRSTDA